MAVTIRVRRGTKVQLDSLMGGGSPMVSGELGFTTDTNEVFVSDGSAAHLVGKAMVGVFASRPTAGVSGRLYHASDTDATYVDDGTSWVDVSSGISDLDDIPDGTLYGKVLNTYLDGNRPTALWTGTTTISGVTIKSHIDDVTIHRLINDLGSAATDLWSAQKIGAEIELAISGLDFQPDVLNYQVDATLDPGVTPTTGDRYIISAPGTMHANFGTITGVGANDIVEYDGAVFVVAYDVSVEGEGALVWNRNNDYFMVYDGTSWSEFGGLAGVTAGTGLTKTGNVINAIAGDGIIVNPDDIEVNVTDLLGTGISEDASNNIRIGAQGNGITGGDGTTLGVQPDSTTGATVAPVSVVSNGVGVTVDNSSLTHTAGAIEVSLVDGGTFV